MRVFPRYNTPLYYYEKSWQLAEGPKLTGANQTLAVASGSLFILDTPQTGNATIRISAAGAGSNEGLEIQKRVVDGFTLTVLDDSSGNTLYVFLGTETRASDFLFDSNAGEWIAGGNVKIAAV